MRCHLLIFFREIDSPNKDKMRPRYLLRVAVLSSRGPSLRIRVSVDFGQPPAADLQELPLGVVVGNYQVYTLPLPDREWEETPMVEVRVLYSNYSFRGGLLAGEDDNYDHVDELYQAAGVPNPTETSWTRSVGMFAIPTPGPDLPDLSDLYVAGAREAVTICRCVA